jgi:hypothetical protein
MNTTNANNIVIGIHDELKQEKIINILKYLCNFTNIIKLYLSKNGLYIQQQNVNHIILFDMDIPSYWFDYYEFNGDEIIDLTIDINAFYELLKNIYPIPIWITHTTNKLNEIMISSEYTLNEIVNLSVRIENYYNFTAIEPLLVLPTNDKYQYHLVIEQNTFKSIIDELIQNDKKELNFHCSNVLGEVILYGNGKPFIILENYNTMIETQDFILTFNTETLAQLPFNNIQSFIIYIFLNPNTPIKISFPLDETDELIDFNINVSPNEVYEVNSSENDFLNMCLHMNNLSL